MLRRTRPDPIALLFTHRARRIPTSSSFPSGHAASAAAFAVGAAIEWPASAVVLGPLAAAVGASRVTTGVHYPSDVLAGAAIGAGAALVSTRLMRRLPRIANMAAGERVPALTSADGQGVTVVMNGSSGTADSISAPLRAALPGAKIVEVEEPVDLEEAFEKAAASAEVLGVAGGDGTVNLAAEIAARHQVPLGVIPAGTLNHLARDLRIESLEDAVDALRSGTAVRMDLPTIAGRPFLNTASIGLYTKMVDIRERYEHRLGKWPAAMLASFSVLRHEPVEVEIDGARRRVWVLFAGNCRYDPRGAAPLVRTRLDDGWLDMRLIHADARAPRLRFFLGLLTRTLRFSGVYEEWMTDRVDVRALQEPVRIARDGETSDGPTGFTIEKSSSLVVYAPHP